MAYPDLATMYQNGMGSVASFMGGQQASMAQSQEQEKLRQMQQATQQAAVMNPLNAQFRQGEISQQAAELPGVQGNSASLVAKGQEDLGLLTERMATKLSAMSTQIGNDGMIKMGQDGEKLAHAAQIIKQYPPHMQKQLFIKAVQQYGGNLESPVFQGVMQARDEDFQPAAETMGKSMALAGQKYQQESSTAKASQNSSERIHKGNNDTQIEVAKIQAASREAAAKARGQMLKHMTSDQQLTALTGIPPDERTDADNARILELSQQRIAERTASSPAVAPTVLGQQTPQQMGQATAAEIHSKGKAAPAAPANLPSGYKLVGTIKGVPTYENAEGKRIQWGK